MLSDDDIKEFQAIYFAKFKKHIPADKALEIYSRLLTLTKEIYHPMTKEGYKKLQERREELGLLETEGEN